MFNFPKASSKTTWRGQGDLWGERGMLPYLGGGSLGLCYGMSAVWIKNGAPADATQLVRGNKAKILDVQTAVHEMSAASVEVALGSSALAASLDVEAERTYGQPASHVILDLLGSDATKHNLLSFYFRTSAGETGAHAIGISFDSPSSGLIFDPNWGVATYDSRSLLCDDLHKLLADYVPGGGYLTEVFLQTVDNADAFGEFQRAS